MKKLAAAVLTLSAALVLSACEKGGSAPPPSAPPAADKAPAAAAPSEPAPAQPPAAPAATGPALKESKVANLGIQAQLPGDAQIEEQKLDMGGARASIMSEGPCGFFYIDEVADGADSLETVKKNAGMMSPVKEWKKEDVNKKDGTFKLVWTQESIGEPGVNKLSLAYRVKAGKKLYDCGKNAVDEATFQCLDQVCGSIAAAK